MPEVTKRKARSMRSKDSTVYPQSKIVVRDSTNVEQAMDDLVEVAINPPSRAVTEKVVLGKLVNVNEQMCDEDWISVLEDHVEELKELAEVLELRIRLSEAGSAITRR